jgi:O-antigen/teichoic acid export membrane protein
MPSNDSISLKEEALKTVVKGAGLSFIGMAISNITLYASRLVVARYMDASEYGMIFLGMLIMNIIMIFATLALEAGVTRYVPYYAAKNEKGKVKGLFASSLKLSIPVGILAFLITFFLSDYIAITFFHEPSLASVIRIFSLAVPFFVAYKIFEAGFIAMKRMDLCTGVRDIFRPLFTILLVFLVLFFGFGFLGATISYAAGFIVMSILSYLVIKRKIFPLFGTRTKAAPMEKKLLKYSIPVLLYTIAWAFVPKIDTLMIGALKTTADVGLYQTALPTSQLVIIPASALGSLFLPVISELLARKKACDINETYKVVSKWSFYIVFPMFLVLFMYSGAIINMLFGYEYIEAKTALSLLAIASLIFMFNSFSMNMLNMLEKNKFLFINSIVTLIAAVYLNYLLIPAYGINGAAIAMAISYSIMTALSILEVRHFCGAHPFHRDMFKSVVAGIVSIIIVYYATKTLFADLNVFILAPMMLVFIALYSLLLLALRGMGKEDIMILKAIEKKTGLRIKFLRNTIKRFI